MGNKSVNILIGSEVSKGPLIGQDVDLSELKKVRETCG